MEQRKRRTETSTVSLESKYLKWLASKVDLNKYGDYGYSPKDYKYLFNILYHCPFDGWFGMDINREQDGVDLRYKFGEENKYDQAYICSELDNRKCSMLEFLIAFAIRLEDDLMYDYEIGDRTGIWFWMFIKNLGLTGYKDYIVNSVEKDDDWYERFGISTSRSTKEEIFEKIRVFNERKYDRFGHGNIFTLQSADKYICKYDLWYQANYFFNEIEKLNIPNYDFLR